MSPVVLHGLVQSDISKDTCETTYMKINVEGTRRDLIYIYVYIYTHYVRDWGLLL